MSDNKFISLPFQLLSTFLLLGIFSLPCCAEYVAVEGTALTRILQSGILRVGVNPNFKPFSYPQTIQRPSSTGKVNDAQVGIDIDIAVLLADGLGVTLDIVIPDNFDQLIPMLQSGDIDIAIASLSRVFERALQVDFTDPYFHTGFSILMNVAKGYRVGIGDAQSYEELKASLQQVRKESELVIAVTRSKSAAGFIQDYFPKAVIRSYDTNEEAAEAVLMNDPAPVSPQIMVHDETFLKLWARDLSRKARQKMVVLPEPFRSDTYGFAVAKGNLEFLQVLNLFISDKLIAQEQMEKFIDSRHYFFIPGIGKELIAREASENGNH